MPAFQVADRMEFFWLEFVMWPFHASSDVSSWWLMAGLALLEVLMC